MKKSFVPANICVQSPELSIYRVFFLTLVLFFYFMTREKFILFVFLYFLALLNFSDI